MSGSLDDIVKLDVGGTRVTVSRSLLTSVRGSLLASYFSGRHGDQIRKIDNRIFVDRDPGIFRLMINYLKDELDLSGVSQFEANLLE